MHSKKRITIGLIGALVVGAVILHNNAKREEDAIRQPDSGRTQHVSAFVPPYYTDVGGAQVPSALPPERFAVAKTRESYRVAAAIPQALMQLPCYCWCDRIDHKSLLDCFVDEHAEFCDICQDSALWAEKRLKEQASTETIRGEIIGRYSREDGGR